MLHSSYIPIVVVINAFITMLTVASGAARLAGVSTRQIATSMTLYNLFQTTFRLLNLLYTPFLATLADAAARTGDALGLTRILRLVILSATVGSVLGFLLLPTFVKLFESGVRGLGQQGSMLGLLWATLRPSSLRRVARARTGPSLLGWPGVSAFRTYRGLMLGQVLGVSVWTIGLLAAHLASVLSVDQARTALMLSGAVNGFGTIFLFVVVDPAASLIVDQCAQDKRPEQDARTMTTVLSLSAVAGTVLAQVLLWPGALWINFVADLIGR